MSWALASPLVYPVDGGQLVDVDGDGWNDIVVSGDAVHFGEPGGGFSGVAPLAKGQEAIGAVFGHLNDDGQLDACRWQWDRLACHTVVGRSLGPAVYVEDTRVRAVHLTDVDGDGDLDILFSGERDIQLRRNEGPAGFVAETFSPELEDRFLEADLDGDGDDDLFAWTLYGRELVWWRRDAGVLGPSEVLLDNISAALSYAFLDVRGDTVPDMISQTGFFPVYLREAGLGGVPSPDSTDTGTIPSGPLSYGPPVAMAHRGAFALADLGGTGRPGLVVTDDDEVVWDATFDDTQALLLGLEPRTSIDYGEVSVPFVQAFDVEGDGVDELLVSDRDLRLVSDVLSGTPNIQTVQHGTDRSGPVAVGDFDGNGHADVVYQDATSGLLRWLPGVGGGAFDHAQAFFAVGVASHLELFDINGDDLPDILSLNDTGRLAVLINDGNGGVEAPIYAFSRAQPGSRSAVVDVDHDGDLEWVIARQGGGLMWGGPDPTGFDGLRFETMPSALVFDTVAAGDLDGDGRAEVAALGAPGVVLYEAADPPVEVDRLSAPGQRPFGVYLADRDGDGADELLVHTVCGPGYPCNDEPLYSASGAPGALSAFTLVGEVSPPLRPVPWFGTADDLVAIDGFAISVFDSNFTSTYLDDRWLLRDLEVGDLDGDGDMDLVYADGLGVRAVWNEPMLPGMPQDSGDTGTTDTGLVTTALTGDTGSSPPPLPTADTASTAYTAGTAGTADTGWTTTAPTGDTALPTGVTGLPASTGGTADTGTAATPTGTPPEGLDTAAPKSDDSCGGCSSAGLPAGGWLLLGALVGLRRRDRVRS